MPELIINDFSTTLASNYTAGDGFLDLTSTTGLITAPYTFTLSVYDASTGALKLHFGVTSLSGSHGVGAAVGSDANATSGDIVVLTECDVNLKRLSGKELLKTLTASSSATLDFTDITSGFDVYEFEFDNIVPASNNVNFQMRLGAGSFDSGANYRYVGMFNGIGDTLTGIQASAQNQTRIAGSVDNTANWSLNGSLKLFGVNGALYKMSKSEVASPASGVNLYIWVATGIWLSTSAADRAQFFFSSGNIASGVIRVYGIRS